MANEPNDDEHDGHIPYYPGPQQKLPTAPDAPPGGTGFDPVRTVPLPIPSDWQQYGEDNIREGVERSNQ